jgi:hypothetical protein
LVPNLYSALARQIGLRHRSATLHRAATAIAQQLEMRRLLSVTLDASGFTDITPPQGARIVYVSSSTGDDRNNGLSPDAPLASIALGASLLRDHSSDQLLLKAGDVWNTGIGYWSKSGKSANEPIVISSYGQGPRPQLDTGTSGGFSAGPSDQALDHVAIMGIHFYADGRAPASPTYVGPQNATGINILSKTNGLLIEDCEIDGYSNDINVQVDSGPIENVSIRRNVIINAYSNNGHSQGIYCYGITNLLLDGNLIDHNGYNDNVPGAGADEFNHDAYISSNNVNVTVQDNIFAEASAYGLQARAGGLVQDNLFLNDPMGMSFGLVNGAHVTPGGVNGIVNGNVFEGGANLANTPLGGGMEIGNTRAGYPTIISNNIFTQSVSRAPAAITLTYGIGDTNPEQAVGINDLTLQSNIINDWYRGIHVDGGFSAGGSGLTAFNDVRVLSNDFQGISGPVLTHDDSFYKGQETWADNRYSSGTAVMVSGAKSLPTQMWNQKDEPRGQINAVQYADSAASVENYDLGNGGAGTVADFLAQVRQQSRQTWQPQYDTAAIINYFRTGFSEVGAAPRDWRAPTPPLASAAMQAAVLDRDTSAQFSVTYTAEKELDLSTIASGNVSLLVAHSKWPTPATLVAMQGSGTTVTVTYSFTPAGGFFRRGKTQKLNVMMNAGQVKDVNGFPVVNGSLGTFKVRVLPRPKPPIVRSVKLINHGQGLRFSFSSDVSASLQVADLILASDDGQTVDPSLMTLSTDAKQKTATWAFSGEPLGAMPAGRWRMRLLAATITDSGGRQLDGNHDGLGGDDYVLVKPLISKGAVVK